MKRTTYLCKHGLIGMPLEARAMVVDDVLDEDGRALLLDHELLAASAEFRLMRTFMDEDDGLERLALRHGEWAWDIYTAAEFLEFLREEPKHLARLTRLVREVLFERFREDATGARPGAA